MPSTFSFHGKQAIIRTSRLDWNDRGVMLESELFGEIVTKYVRFLRKPGSELLGVFPEKGEKEQIEAAVKLLVLLSKMKRADLVQKHPEMQKYFADSYLLDQFVEHLYNYWRSFERYLVLHSNAHSAREEDIDKKPYTVFHDTIETLNHQFRGLYRDIRENITGEHPIIFRQVPAGFQVGIIAAQKDTLLPKEYKSLDKIPIISQVLIHPPLIIDPPMNKRKGMFEVVDSNPLDGARLNEKQWLCFPAKVGELIIHLYFHEYYTGIGIATANLFELGTAQDLKKKPDAIYAMG
ncbi:MAG: hypothetical protein NUV67_02410, partial [archaeon]|nr:hypothetical protein [archaeon]